MPVDLRNFGQKFGDISVDDLSIEGDLIGTIGGTPTWTGDHTFENGLIEVKDGQSFAGEPDTDFGRLQYVNNQWYIQSGDNSQRIGSFRDADGNGIVLVDTGLVEVRDANLDMSGNDIENAGTVEAGILETSNFVDAANYATLQAAIDDAATTGHKNVHVPVGEYDPVTIDTDGMALFSLTPASVNRNEQDTAALITSGSDEPCVQINATSCYLENIAFWDTTDGAHGVVVDGEDCTIHRCTFAVSSSSADTIDGNGIQINSDFADVTNCKTRARGVNGDHVVIDADRCIVDSLGGQSAFSLTVTDNGNGNRLGEIA